MSVEEKVEKRENLQSESSNEKITKKETASKQAEKKQIDPKMEMISAYNGDITDKYVWSQSVTDVTVQVRVPEGTKSKMVI